MYKKKGTDLSQIFAVYPWKTLSCFHLPWYQAHTICAPGHLKQMLTSNHCVLPITDGRVACGHAQEVYFVEFDGLKVRKYTIQVMGE